MMRRLRFIVRLIAGGAGLLPLLAHGHGSGFLDARFELRDARSPMPQTEVEPKQPHQLLTAYWRWAAPGGEVRFFAPETSQQTVLFWLREPDVSPPRWSLLVPSDRTPVIIVKRPWWTQVWLWGAIIAGILLGVVTAIRLLLRRRRSLGMTKDP